MTTQTRKITFAAAIGALYAVLTIGITLFGFGMIQFGPIQFRIAEALTIFPFFFPFSVWGLFIGVIIANIFSPYPLDIIVGPIATLIAALLTMRLGLINRNSLPLKALACAPPVIINAIMIGAMIAWVVTGGGSAFWPAFVTFGLQIGLGQLVVLYALGLPLMVVFPKLPFYKSLLTL